MVKTVVHYQERRYWVELVGNATFTHHIEVKETDLHQASVNAENCTITATGEQGAYEQFINCLPKFNLSQRN
jgi:diaminopimelate epimerase